MVKTTNGGSTWSSLVVPTGASSLNGMACPTSTTCYAGGEGGSGADIFATTDGGSSWTTQTAPYPVGVLSSIACTSGSHCVAVGYNTFSAAGTGAVISTIHGGTNWKTSPLPANVYALSTVVCPTTTACVAAGDSISGAAEIVTSGDGVTTWSDANAPGEADFVGTACSSARRCYAVGGGSPSGGVIYTGRLP
jgi:photosystem II stability/assembly factor-like uncharacterized protein